MGSGAVDDGQKEPAGDLSPSPVEEAFGAYVTEAAARADRLRAEAARSLVTAARQAAAMGWSQRRIGAALGRSQPEVARLLRRVELVSSPPGAVSVAADEDRSSPGPLEEPASMLGRVLGSRREAVVAAAERNGASNVRVFGSVARGQDGPDSDVDLLVDPGPEMGLFELARLEIELTEILGRRADVVPARSLRPVVAATVQAIPL